MPLSLVPKILNAIDMILSVSKKLAVIDTPMVKGADI